MKSIKDYLTESKKTYKFKIGVAGELPEGINERMRNMLEKFKVVNLSAGKKTPIQEKPLDFPQLKNEEVTYWNVEIEYPTTVEIMKQHLGDTCSIHKSHIVVHNPNAPVVTEKEVKENETYEPLITKEDMGGESAQQNVGQTRIMDLLKELESARKERGDSQDGFKMEVIKEKPQNTKSAMGS